MWVVGSDHEGLISQVTNSNRFDSLVVAHGDDHWNRWLQVGGYMFRVTTGLHIVCDRDYDAGHPAGTLLDDLISVYYKGLDDFLVHGEYLLHFVTEQQKRNKWSFYEFEEMLSEFNLKRHKLIGSSFVFRLKKSSRSNRGVCVHLHLDQRGRQEADRLDRSVADSGEE